MPSQTVTILLVEDNKLDELAFQRGLNKHRIANPLVVAENGQIALDMLRGENGHARIPQPRVVFLDLNMPVMNGLEFLQAIRDDPVLKSLVVFVLTTSDDDKDLLHAYEKQVAGYILKGNLGDACLRLIELLRTYWRIVELPEDPS